MLVDLNIKDFAEKVASHKPAVPAGGSVMALSGLMGICLVEMSVNSVCEHSENVNKDYEETKIELAGLHHEVLMYIDQDAEAYGSVLAAYKMPKADAKEKEQRQKEIQAAALAAIEVPLKISQACIRAMHAGIILMTKVKQGVLGDLKTGLLLMKTVVEGSLITAKTNLQLLKQDTLKTVLQDRMDEMQGDFDKVIADLQ